MTPEDRKEFCPNCEAVVPCTHEAELFVCDICGEDFAKYIVSRKADVSDYSVTQDVLTDIKTPRSIENKLTDTEACNGRLVEQVEQLTAERDAWKAGAERLVRYQYEMSFGKFDITDDINSEANFVFICRHCHNYSKTKETIAHAADCVFELYRQLLAQYGENSLSNDDITG